MKKTRALGALVVICALSACGGGGGGGGGSTPAPAPSTPPPTTPPTTPPPATPSVGLTLSTPPISLTLAFGDDAKADVTGRWTAANLGSAQVYLQVADDGGTFVTPAVTASGNPDFVYSLPLSNAVVPGTRAGTITVRACEDVQCVKPYASASQTLSYKVEITPMPEWETTQGNAAHNAYVPITLDVTRFAKAWEWKRPAVSTSTTTGPIFPVVTSGRMVYVAADGVSTAGPGLFALDEKDGTVKWSQQFTLRYGSLNPPAASGGTVYVPTTGHEDTFLWAFDAADGTPQMQSGFRTQWADILAPTVKDGVAYVNSGYYGGVVYAFERSTGLKKWEASGGTYGMNTPALDDANRLYAHNGSTLTVLDSRDGTLLGSIGPQPGGLQVDHRATPIVGAANSVTGFVGDWYNETRPLRNYAIDTSSERWTSVKTYRAYPAVAKGVIYAASNNPKSFDAIDEKTGQVLWSWIPGTADTVFFHNVVVTNNLAFVSTNRALYAIDLATRKPVWQTPTPGQVAISASRMLYIMPGTTDVYGYPSSGSDGRLLAFRTR